jgi:hypothetical protein
MSNPENPFDLQGQRRQFFLASSREDSRAWEMAEEEGEGMVYLERLRVLLLALVNDSEAEVDLIRLV